MPAGCAGYFQGEALSCASRCLSMRCWQRRTVDGNAARRLRLFPRLLKIMAVMGGGKTVRAVTGLRSESANGMCELLSWMFELLASPFAGCAAGSGARKMVMQRGCVAIPTTVENHGGYGMPVKRCER